MEFVALGLALALVLANGFFVAVEFALVKVRPTQLEALRRPGEARGGPGGWKCAGASTCGSRPPRWG